MSRGIYKTKFRRSIKELREFIKENDIKLLGLWEYIRKRSNKKIQKEAISNVKNNS
ncbi:MAG: hypothetical protein KAX30_01425 [Candidatus Atribacteria bacterium]|nr:hypothetical protein [Candidatus Atribacteria bacterium]